MVSWRKSDSLPAFSVFTAACTFLLVIAGGLVTSTGSGLAVPDWPLSFGRFFPPMRGGVLFEHGHRMIAGTVGVLFFILTVWIWTKESRRGLKILSVAGLITVILQAVLGGLTVLHKLPTAISASHACLGQVFFAIVVNIAVLVGDSDTISELPYSLSLRAQRSNLIKELRPLSLATSAVIFVQLFLGAWMRHSGPGLSIKDFPLAFGRLIPPLEDPLVAIHFAHRVGALVIFTLIARIVFLALKHHRENPQILAPALLMGAFVLMQIVFGALIIWSAKAVLFTTAHVALGALLLAASSVLSARYLSLQKLK